MSPGYHSTFAIRDVAGLRLTDVLEIHYVELPKLVWSDEKMGDALSRWGRFLTAKSPEDLEVLALDDPVMRKAIETLEYLSQDPEVREQYWQRQKGIQTYLTDMAGERREGREEGRREGREEGRQEGREEGREEGLLEAARRFLSYGMSAGDVGRALGLAPDVVAQLTDSANRDDEKHQS